MASISIFIVEDEPSIAQTVQFALEAEAFATEHYPTGAGCLAALERASPSLILLDVGLADGSGFEFFRRIRQQSEAPVIFMTARGDEIDRVVGLEMGADDYIVKPFSLRELVARVRVVLRRVDAAAAAGTEEPALARATDAGGVFRIDTVRRQIYYHAQPLAPGMVFTVDPQMWVPEEELYIPILEDHLTEPQEAALARALDHLAAERL